MTGVGFLEGKRCLIAGVASERSLAWGIAQAMHRQGAELAFSYQGERFAERMRELAARLGSTHVFPCDVSSDSEIDGLFRDLGRSWNGLDVIVHSVAFAPREALEGRYLDSVERESFRIAHDISSYSFVALAKRGRSLMTGRQGALLTLSYLGAVQAIPNYNVMGPAKASLEANVRFMAFDLGADGHRVNALSPGPVKTLAASGVSGFRKMLSEVQARAALKRNVRIEEVGNAAAFLCSDLASGITGEILYVDCGYHIVGMPPFGEG
ncbi:short-chain dehydrogenase/reductase SDR [mine drainage metagenome]|uniref:Short-chain dehydrogenase/reductase SDR n=2 Tax=mine drainage metagenome TaxID=410659 RepID=T1BFU6_9ZZZZ